MAHDVFISYSHDDKAFADAACAKLERHGVRCWIAPRDAVPGAEWAGSIIHAINDSRVMVLVFSAKANESPQINKEVERAVHKGVVVVPVRIEDVIPAESLEYFIGNVHWLDALTPPIENHLDHLADTVKMFLERTGTRGAVLSAAPSRPESRPAPRSSPADSAARAKSSGGRSFWLRGLLGTMVLVIVVLAVVIWHRNLFHRATSAPVAVATTAPGGGNLNAAANGAPAATGSANSNAPGEGPAIAPTTPQNPPVASTQTTMGGGGSIGSADHPSMVAQYSPAGPQSSTAPLVAAFVGPYMTAGPLAEVGYAQWTNTDLLPVGYPSRSPEINLGSYLTFTVGSNNGEPMQFTSVTYDNFPTWALRPAMQASGPASMVSPPTSPCLRA